MRSNSEATHVCPWWLSYVFDNPLRRCLHDPARILGPYVEEGMKVADLGCGAGYFSIGLAHLVGPTGRVLAVDLQPFVLKRLVRRARSAGVAERLEVRRGAVERLGPGGDFGFVLAFWMVHEVPDRRRMFAVVRAMLRPGGRVLVAEPRRHVSAESLEESARHAIDEGFCVVQRPRIALSRAVLLVKPA